MTKKNTLLFLAAISTSIAASTVAIAAMDFNSSRSNVSAIPIPPDLSFSFEFNFSTNRDVSDLTPAQFEVLVDQALAQARKDVMAKHMASKVKKRAR